MGDPLDIGMKLGDIIGKDLGVNEKIGQHMDKAFDKSDKPKMDKAERDQAKKTREHIEAEKAGNE